MPLFKTNDFWSPNNTYYATSRYKSVIMYENQLYVCTDTHTSGSAFDESKFDLIGGSGGGSNFNTNFNGVDLSIKLTNQHPATLIDLYECQVTTGSTFETLTPSSNATEIDGTTILYSIASTGVVDFKNKLNNKIKFKLPDNLIATSSNGNYVIIGFVESHYTLSEIYFSLVSGGSSVYSNFITAAADDTGLTILNNNKVSNSTFIHSSPTNFLEECTLDINTDTREIMFSSETTFSTPINVGTMPTIPNSVELQGFVVVLSTDTEAPLHDILIDFKETNAADIIPIDFGAGINDGDLIKVGVEGYFDNILYKENDIILLYDNLSKGILYYTNTNYIKRNILLDNKTLGGTFFILPISTKANKKYRIRLCLIHKTTGIANITYGIILPGDQATNLIGNYSSPNNRGVGTDNTTTRFYAPDGTSLSLTVSSQTDWVMSTFDGEYQPSIDGEIRISVNGASSITLRKGSYFEIEELI